MLVTIQFLEDSPDLFRFSAREVAKKLREAAQIIPISHVLIGWHLPSQLLNACLEETKRMNAKFIRWQPLLTGDGEFKPKREWQVVGLDKERVNGFKQKEEFTFVCPNNHVAHEAIQEHLIDIIHSNIYDGIFFDRIRYPSPARNPLKDLGCFCEDCQNSAAKQGINLKKIHTTVIHLVQENIGRIALGRALLGNWDSEIKDEYINALEQLLVFRTNSISRMVKGCVQTVQAKGMEVGLNCFSPSLTPLVGQDIATLGNYADWIKIMTYAHTFGPAGLPFELLGVIDFFTNEACMSENEAIHTTSKSTGIPLPTKRGIIKRKGLSSKALSMELAKAHSIATKPILAGIELVDIAGVTGLNNNQIEGDLIAIKSQNIAGLSLSWDLWHIPLQRLDLVRKVWQDEFIHKNIPI